jgi:hypothetical protein
LRINLAASWMRKPSFSVPSKFMSGIYYKHAYRSRVERLITAS